MRQTIKETLKITAVLLVAITLLLPVGIIFICISIAPIIGAILLLPYPWFLTISAILIGFVWMVFTIVLYIQTGGRYADWIFRRLDKWFT